MPLYEYKCSECDTKIEVIRPINSENTDENCPNCGKILVKLVGIGGFNLKGSGWAKDGYK